MKLQLCPFLFLFQNHSLVPQRRCCPLWAEKFVAGLSTTLSRILPRLYKDPAALPCSERLPGAVPVPRQRYLLMPRFGSAGKPHPPPCPLVSTTKATKHHTSFAQMFGRPLSVGRYRCLMVERASPLLRSPFPDRLADVAPEHCSVFDAPFLRYEMARPPLNWGLDYPRYGTLFPQTETFVPKIHPDPGRTSFFFFFFFFFFLF